jgi:hypothetical membrane protein
MTRVLAARVSMAAAVAVLVLLSSLHLLSPEFDPSWRVVSEYARGNYGWVLSLMFVAWALSSWALGLAIWPEVNTLAGKIGWIFLLAAGVGQAMASVFDVDHPLHGTAGAIGVLSMPVAAILVSMSLGRVEPWFARRKSLMWSANLIWVSLVLFIVTMVVLIVTARQAGGMNFQAKTLPAGVIALDGWFNRLYVVTCCVWTIAVGRVSALRTREEGCVNEQNQVSVCG